MTVETQQHYETFLAPLYVWMMGGREHAFAIGNDDIAELVPGDGLAIDLGAGFGMHAVPLARSGYRVLAIDASATLLDLLRADASGLSLEAVEADLREFRRHAKGTARLIVCLGDTLTHLGSVADVERLASDVAASLTPGGRFVATFRDYSRPNEGDARFILVRSDATRIHTCFLEDQAEHITVHDVVHELEGDAWRMRLSSYPKLKLAPATVVASLRSAGLDASVSQGPRGMVRVLAHKR